MSLRLLHTSDWHLGQTLREWDRAAEHRAFLAWLLDRVDEHRPDALLVAGDVFDHSNPSAEATETWFRFLADARRRRPSLSIVVIGGNHDSPARLDAPRPLLEALGVHVVGGLPPRKDGRLDGERLIVPLPVGNDVAARVLAMPFLRPADLVVGDGESLADGVVRLYDEAFALADTVPGRDLPLVAMGHLFCVGGEVSALSERRILGGHQHAVPSRAFPKHLAYVALGHLHLAQRVGGREEVRYAGSPLPLSTAEGHYKHQALLVEIDGAPTRVTPLYVPRRVPFLRLPARGAAPPDEALAALAALPDARELPEDAWPFVELHVVLTAPEPALPRRIEQALEGRAGRLVRVVRERGGAGESLIPSAPHAALADLSPLHVFEQLHTREHGGPPAPELQAAFDELLTQVQGALP